jgi:hypothetical protein
MREMLLSVPILFIFQFCTTMNNFAGTDLTQFLQMWAYWIAWNFICRVLVDPIVFNLQRFKIMFHNWFLEKSKNDDFYEKFLSFFSLNKRYSSLRLTK